jgi:predicted membrane protein
MTVKIDKMAPGMPGIAWLPLSVGLGLLMVMTVLPSIATNAAGRADHPAALLLFWSMSAGFVRGVGFVPYHPVPRLLLSAVACLIALGLALLRLHFLGRLG